MDLSAKVLREVEFRDRLRGYDTDEVDEFLEKVAVAVEELQEKMRQLAYRAERAERSVSERADDVDDDTIRRTLVLAQRTADMAVGGPRAGGVLMDGARRSPRGCSARRARAQKRLASEAERRHSDDIARLERQRDQVRDELKELSELLDSERKRLADSLRAALRFVERTLPGQVRSPSFARSRLELGTAARRAVSRTRSRLRSTRTPRQRPRRWRLGGSESESDLAGSEHEEARAGLAAVPPLEDSGPPTQAWQAEPMTIFGQGGDKVAGAKVRPAPASSPAGPTGSPEKNPSPASTGLSRCGPGGSYRAAPRTDRPLL